MARGSAVIKSLHWKGNDLINILNAFTNIEIKNKN